MRRVDHVHLTLVVAVPVELERRLVDRHTSDRSQTVLVLLPPMNITVPRITRVHVIVVQDVLSRGALVGRPVSK